MDFPFLSSNIPSASAYGVYASQLIRSTRCCHVTGLQSYQVIHGNDQNTPPTNQKTAGSNLERTS